jgi:DNA-directed RNA polymerase subunit E'/Rpb7
MTDRKFNRDKDREDRKIFGVYLQSMLTMKVMIPITQVGKNMKNNLEKIISKKTEGKCIVEGFIKPNSVKILRYSSGTINNDFIEFQTVFECMVCHPVEGMLIECDAKTITKAGIHAEVTDENGSVPITVFIARDHHFTDRRFSDIKENMKIIVRVIGVRFELNDPYICVIGKYIEQKKEKESKKRGGTSSCTSDEESEYSRPVLTINDEDYLSEDPDGE